MAHCRQSKREIWDKVQHKPGDHNINYGLRQQRRVPGFESNAVILKV